MTHLTKQCRRLITRNACDRDLSTKQGRVSKHFARRPHFRQYFPRHIEQSQQLFVPITFVDIEQHRAAGVAGIGGMHAAFRQLPQQPRIHSPERQLSFARPLLCALDVLQNPLQFGGRKVRIQNESRFPANHPIGLLPAKLVTDVSGAAILPNDRIADRIPCPSIPDNRCLTLIRNSDCCNLARIDLSISQDRFGRS